VAYLPRLLYIRVLSKHGDSPTLLGLNLMYCGSWNWSVCRLCNL